MKRILLILMFSLASRAFTITRSNRHWIPKAHLATGRFMSSGSSEADTSVVDRCTQKIQKALETNEVKVTGAYDDPNGSHVTIEVVSQMFEGKRPVQRQQLVYKAIWEELQGPVHAVDALICKTPDEK